MGAMASALSAFLLSAQPFVLEVPQLRWSKTEFRLSPDHIQSNAELVVAELPVRIGAIGRFRLDIPVPDGIAPPTGVTPAISVQRPDGGKLWVTWGGLGGSF